MRIKAVTDEGRTNRTLCIVSYLSTICCELVHKAAKIGNGAGCSENHRPSRIVFPPRWHTLSAMQMQSSGRRWVLGLIIYDM